MLFRSGFPVAEGHFFVPHDGVLDDAGVNGGFVFGGLLFDVESHGNELLSRENKRFFRGGLFSKLGIKPYELIMEQFDKLGPEIMGCWGVFQ